ncbi:MAG: DPP IV N-terminal domain-containing protein [bacterium]
MNRSSTIFFLRSNVRHTLVLLVIGLLFVLSGIAFAQQNQPSQLVQKANFELANKYKSDKLTNLIHDQAVRPNWLEKSDKFWYRYKTTKGATYYIVDPEKKSKALLFDHQKLTADLIALKKKPFNPNDLTLQNIKFTKENKTFEFELDSIKYEYNLATQEVVFKDSVKKKDDDSWKSFSPDSTVVIFAKNHNLYWMKANDKDSVEHQITTDGEKYNSYGSQSDDTTKNKRRRASVSWSKDSKKFIFTRTDSRHVSDLWVINSLSNPRPTLETYKYEMPGEKNIPQSYSSIYDFAGQKATPLDVKKWIDQSVGGFQWAKNSDKFYLTRRSRDLHKTDVCVADALTGKVAELFNEHIDVSLEAQPLVVLNGGEEFMWYSLRDGWGHYYRYDATGKLKNRVTVGGFMVDGVAAIDTAKGVVFFNCVGKEEERDPYYNHVYRVNFDGTSFQFVTPENATHAVSINESRKYFVDNFSRVDQEPKSVLRDSKGNPLIDLETMDISLLKEIGWKAPEVFKTKAADGITDIYGVMWKPLDFDPAKKYPIIAHVYPGPQTESVPKNFTPTNGNFALAQVGFIVITLGNRGGSPQRALWYQEYGQGNLRDYGLDDKKAVIEQLAYRHSFIDLNRVGIYGHSGGGFMTAAAMMVYPDFFKVGVASSGNHDNNVYNRWWGETHHGVKEELNKKDSTTSFKIKIPTNPELAANLKGHLLLVTGDIDNNVHPANTIRLVDALIKANKRFDFMIMPGQRHGYGPYQTYFTRMMWNYFAEHLLGDYHRNVDMFEDVLDTKTVRPAPAEDTETSGRGRRR